MAWAILFRIRSWWLVRAELIVYPQSEDNCARLEILSPWNPLLPFTPKRNPHASCCIGCWCCLHFSLRRSLLFPFFFVRQKLNDPGKQQSEMDNHGKRHPGWACQVRSRFAIGSPHDLVIASPYSSGWLCVCFSAGQQVRFGEIIVTIRGGIRKGQFTGILSAIFSRKHTDTHRPKLIVDRKQIFAASGLTKN